MRVVDIEKIEGVLMLFVLLFTGIILTVKIQSLDTSTWNFTGSDIAKGFVSFFPQIFVVVSAGIIILVAWRNRKNE